MGYKATTFDVTEVADYVPVGGVIANKVLCVDRNGIGVRVATFGAGSVSVSAQVYEWYGVQRQTLQNGEYIIVLSDSITTVRDTLYEFGANVQAGRTYALFYQGYIAKYTAQAGDDATDLRNGLKTALEAVSWPSFTVTCTSVSTNRLAVQISLPSVNFIIYIGRQKFKKGYWCTLNSINYIIYGEEDFDAFPVLPPLAINYIFADLISLTGSVETYLREPLTAISYTSTSAGTTDISAVPSSGLVPFNSCVVHEPSQRIYFSDLLGIGEKIKVFQQ